MSTQFSTSGSGISNVGGLDEMLAKLGMSMETAPLQPVTQNTQLTPSLANTNSFITGFMQPPLQTSPAPVFGLNYVQPLPFQPLPILVEFFQKSYYRSFSFEAKSYRIQLFLR